MNNKTNFSASDNGIINNASRDVINNYYQITQTISREELLEIIKSDLINNYPILTHESQKESIRNVKNFADLFFDVINTNREKIDFEKFASSEIQHDVHNAIMQVAKRGENANYKLLVDLILEKVNVDETNDILDPIFSDLIVIVPKLNTDQLNVLSLITLIRNLTINSSKGDTISSLEKSIELNFQSLLKYTSNSSIIISTLKSYGCVESLGVGNFTLEKFLNFKYSDLKNKSLKEIEIRIESNTTYLKKVKEVERMFYLQSFDITLPGKILGMINLSKIYPGINYKDYLK